MVDTTQIVAVGVGIGAVYFGYFGILRGLYLILITFLSCLSGFLIVCLYYGRKHSNKTFGQARTPLQPLSRGIPQVVEMMDKPKIPPKLDRRLTGASNIDEQLQSVLDYIFRDFIFTWYSKISDDTEFVYELRKIFNVAIANLASRAKEIEWSPFFTETLVDELASHVKLYRRAEQKVRETMRNHKSQEYRHAIEEKFFEFEYEMEDRKLSRKAVCTDNVLELSYLKEITEALLYFSLPEDSFDDHLFRSLVREVIVNTVIKPTISRASSADYINQNIIWMCNETAFTSESLITTLKLSDSIGEIQAVQIKVTEEISRTRAKDKGDANDAIVKQSLSSLAFLSKICENQTKRLSIDDDVTDGFVHDQNELRKKMANYSHYTWRECLKNEYFKEYMEVIEKESYLLVMQDIREIERLGALQLSRESDSHKLIAIETITEFYDKHFGSETPTLKLTADEEVAVEPIKTAITEKQIDSRVLTELKNLISKRLSAAFADFQQHTLYMKMIDELELQKDTETCSLSSFPDDQDDVMVSSVNDDDSASMSSLESQISITSATIVQTGIVKETEDSSIKPYVIYSLKVDTLTQDKTNSWDCNRRYSDFFDLYTHLSDQYKGLGDLQFPGKRTFNNMSKDLIAQRAAALNAYIQNILTSREYQNDVELQRFLLSFLKPGVWTKPKHSAAYKVGSFVNNTMRNMSNKVRQVQVGDVIDGIGKVFKNISIAPTMSKNQLDRYKVMATLDSDDEYNIPMRIMLLLLDEVFDLRKKNQWLRRSIVAIVRQIIKATYGDKINKKIVDHVNSLTSADAVAEYVKQFKDRFWPAGILAEPDTERDQETELRTRVVCKSKMIGSVPDELRHVIGTETTRTGVLRIFKMFQHDRLNKRLIYVILETFIQNLYPANSFDEVFTKIHTQTSRGRSESNLSNNDLLTH